MFVQLCIILRITLHEASHHYRVDGFNYVPCDATKEPPRDLMSKTTLKTLKDLSSNEITGIRDAAIDKSLHAGIDKNLHAGIDKNLHAGIDKNLHSQKMWINKPSIDHSRLIQQNLNEVNHLNNDRHIPVALRHPHSITKLAKTLTYGFDPYFSKGSFEPFETRPRPITLVAFRKNGLAPRETMKPDTPSAEVAELQSPYNTISSFWSDSGFNS